jgi:tRNA nucleotidyltransferase (CCA-adding enzyme)
VEPATLEDDLRRRDFALNAMALSLRPDGFGELVDPTGGWEDLAAGRLRVLHAGSFRDDPTRVLRGVRFEARFGFEMEPRTAALAREAVAAGAMGTLTPERLRDAPFLLCGESAWGEAAQRLEALGFWNWLSPGLSLEYARLRRAAEALAWWRAAGLEALAEPLVAVAAVLAPGGEPAVAAAAARLRLSPAEEHSVRAGLSRAAPQSCTGPPSPSQFRRWLEGVPPEALASLLSTAAPGADRERWEQYLRDWRRVRLAITGDDLLAEGWEAGPELGAALRATLDARLDGCIMGRESELEFARAWRARRAAGTERADGT